MKKPRESMTWGEWWAENNAEPRPPKKEIQVLNGQTAMVCPLCGIQAVVALTTAQLATQPDETTHVCHPALGGCNHGFRAASTWEVM